MARGVEFVRRQAHVEIDRARAEKEEDRDRELVLKAATLRITPNQRTRLKVNLAGRSVFGVTSSLHLNRMRSLGFLHESISRGVAQYRIHATLDASTTQICRNLHGKVFDVATGYQRLTKVLDTDDPDQIKFVQPWPDPKNAGDLKGMSSAELAAAGHEIPPYHHLCRTVITLVDQTVETVSTSVSEVAQNLGGGQAQNLSGASAIEGASGQAGGGLGFNLQSPTRNLIRGTDELIDDVDVFTDEIVSSLTAPDGDEIAAATAAAVRNVDSHDKVDAIRKAHREHPDFIDVGFGGDAEVKKQYPGLERYVFRDYDEINHALRNRGALSQGQEAVVDEIQREAKELGEDLVLWRGSNFPEISELQINSVSRDINTSIGFIYKADARLFRLRVDGRVKVVAFNSSEAEFIIPPGAARFVYGEKTEVTLRSKSEFDEFWEVAEQGQPGKTVIVQDVHVVPASG